MIISIDCETTGLDIYHDACPFFVTIQRDDGQQECWEWEIDPESRQVLIEQDEVDRIRQCIKEAEFIIGQNIKFDVKALQTIGVVEEIEDWPWDKTYDTLIAAHLLWSNKRKDLTSLAVQYLGKDIQPFEERLAEATQAARRWCRSHHKSWRIAHKDDPRMPSCYTVSNNPNSKIWRNDYWLPKALYDNDEVIREERPHYQKVLKEYANTDSATTLLIWQQMEGLIKNKGLWKIFLERMRILEPAVAMEKRGVTVIGVNFTKQYSQYVKEVEEYTDRCIAIADSYGYELKMPAGSGNNESLHSFCFDVMKLPVVHFTDGGKSGDVKPSLNSDTVETWTQTLSSKSKELLFAETILKRKNRCTALSYMDAYERFWLPLVGEEGWYVIHPTFNPTGADTLRWSSNNPNAQNISKDSDANLRFCFGPTNGREWWSLDYKNIERRIPAYEAGEEDIIRLFENEHEPPYFGSEHLLVAHLLHKEAFEQCINEEDGTLDGRIFKERYKATLYQWVKNGNFAVQYGCWEPKADATYRVKGAYRLLKKRFKKQEELNQYWIRFANEHGYVLTIPDKSIDPEHGYPIMCTRLDNGYIKPTIPLNYHVQSTAMQCTSRAMVRIHSFFKSLNRGEMWDGRKWPGGYYLALQVHDELVPDCPSGKLFGHTEKPWEYNLPIMKHVKKLMEQSGGDIGIPLPVNLEYHEVTWAKGLAV